MFTVIAGIAVVSIIGAAKSIKLVVTDGFGRVPTRTF